MMKFPYQLSAVLMGVAICLVQPQMILALTTEEVEAIAKEITVKIDGESAGSGVIIERQGNKYFVLTNRHVVERPGRYEIQTPDGKRYPVYYKQEIPGLDLAVLQFESDNSYNTAKLGNSDEMTGAIAVYVSGWADKLPGVNERTYQFSGGQITSRLQNPENGYALMFTNPTIPGTSGGPMLDEDGRLVGINGKAIFDQRTQRTFSFGIPINSFQSTRNTLKPLEESSPTVAQQPTAEGLISLGGSKANQGDYQGALAYYNQALRIDPNNVDAYFRRGIAFFEIKDYQAAIKDFNQVVRLSPDNDLAYFLRGLARSFANDKQGAIEDYTQAIRLNAQYAEAYNNRGVEYEALGDYQKAIADYTESIRLKNPELHLPYRNRGDVNYKLKNYPAAIADYDKALSFLEYSGIGVRFVDHEGKPGMFIGGISNNSPASQSVLKVGDQVIALNGKSTLNKTAEELNQIIDTQIRNQKILQVTLKIKREGEREFEVTLTKASITNPESASIYYLRGKVRRELKDYQGAISDFTQAIERKPDYVDAYNNRGIIYDDLKDYQKAIADYNRAIQIQPDYAHAYYNLGQSYRALGEKQKALESYQKAAELYKQQENTEDYQDALERISELQGTAAPPAQRDYQAEIAAANLAIKKNPNDAEAYLERAVAYYNLGDKQKALQDLVQATRLNPKHSLAWYDRAWILFELGRNEEALTSLTRAIQANTQWGDRSLTDAYNLRCGVRNQIGDYQKAIDDCNQALSLNPRYYSAYVNRGLALVGQGKVQEAIEDYNRAIQLDPNNLWAYDRRGEAHADQGDYQGAIADYTEIIRLDDKNVVAYALRGMNYQRLGDTQEAIKDFNQAIQLDPNNAVALAVRGLSYHLQGDYIGSLAAYEASVTKDPKFYLAIANIGLVKYELGDMEAAMTQFEKALAIDKNSAEIQLALGVALYTSGNQPRGLAMAEKALQRDKRFANVEFLKKNLWGERIIADTQKLLETPRIQELLKKLKTGS